MEVTAEFSTPNEPWGGDSGATVTEPAPVHSWADEAAGTPSITAGVPPPAAVPAAAAAAAPLPAYNTTEDWATQVSFVFHHFLSVTLIYIHCNTFLVCLFACFHPIHIFCA